jgi:thiosulfate/3-mercaptopyruvate sulfurtransferase
MTHPSLIGLREGVLDVAQLQALAAVSPVRLIEIQAHRPDAGAAARAPLAAGAVQVFWKDLLWLPDIRDFPDHELLQQRLRALGLDTDAPIVVYGEHRQYGFYARWALRHAGLRQIFVLERPELLASPLPQAAADAATVAIEPAPAPRRAFRQDVLDALRNGGIQIVDARSREEYDGWRVSPSGGLDHGAERAGHVPGAVNLHYQDLIDEHGALKPLDELRRRVAAAGIDGTRPIIAYCRLSHRASLLTYVLQEKLGYGDVRLYDGSWTEWGSTVGSPIAHNRPVQATWPG